MVEFSCSKAKSVMLVTKKSKVRRKASLEGMTMSVAVDLQ